MNPLQEYPNLFANGKFKARHKNINDEPIRGIIDNVLFRFPQSKVENCKDCTLIARPIEDMSDEEISNLLSTITDSETKNYKFASSLYEGDHRIFYKERRRKNEYRFDRMVFSTESANRNSFLYLLSIGVYPFDQSHFEHETVIDVTKEL